MSDSAGQQKEPAAVLCRLRSKVFGWAMRRARQLLCCYPERRLNPSITPSDSRMLPTVATSVLHFFQLLSATTAHASKHTKVARLSRQSRAGHLLRMVHFSSPQSLLAFTFELLPFNSCCFFTSLLKLDGCLFALLSAAWHTRETVNECKLRID